MTINKKMMTMLILVMAVGAISITYATTTFFGEDCTFYNQEDGVDKVCNDLNNLNDRLYYVEHESFSVNLGINDGVDYSLLLKALGTHYQKDNLLVWDITNSTGDVYASGNETLTEPDFEWSQKDSVPVDTYTATVKWDGEILTDTHTIKKDTSSNEGCEIVNTNCPEKIP